MLVGGCDAGSKKLGRAAARGYKEIGEAPCEFAPPSQPLCHCRSREKENLQAAPVSLGTVRPPEPSVQAGLGGRTQHPGRGCTRSLAGREVWHHI